MLKKMIIMCLLLSVLSSYGQIFINELDTDTPGIDTQEFIELKSDTPYFPLDGYILVFFNGNPTASNANSSYYTIDLAGLVTDINGIVHIGNNDVSPVPSRIIPNNVVQNGEDAVAIYQANINDFPENTLATTENLIDALVYGNNNPIATTLLTLLNVSEQINESMNGLGTIQSIQRKPDGTYEVKAPTPGANNDGSGVVFNGITITAPTAHLNEGDSFDITFTTQFPVVNGFSFEISLNYGTFNEEDFIGDLIIPFYEGETSYTTTIQIIDDEFDEGDEELRISFISLPEGYVRMNDNIIIRVIDNDFTQSAWGTPLAPTYGVVENTMPEGFYESLNNKAGDELKQAIQDIISNPDLVRAHTYGDVITILNQADQNPEHSNEVWLMYVEQGRAKLDFQTTGNSVGKWNREHIFPQSRGGFANATPSYQEGINIWLSAGPDDLWAGHSDAHHIRAEDGPENSSRGNKDFGLDDYNGPLGNLGSWKGDVARAIFYMAVRYNLLDVVQGNPPDSTPFQLGDLNTLLQWHMDDPSDDFEMNRNNIIYEWQQNRNPFIDLPELANYIWGTNAGEVWQSDLSVTNQEFNNFTIYPIPAQDFVYLQSNMGYAHLQIIGMNGIVYVNQMVFNNKKIDLNLSAGIYIAKVTIDSLTRYKRILIK
jgi:hypothetical protein